MAEIKPGEPPAPDSRARPAAADRLKNALAGGDLAVAAMFLAVWLRPGLLGAASLPECMLVFYLAFCSIFFLAWTGTAVLLAGERRAAGFLAGLAVFVCLLFFFWAMFKGDPFLKNYFGGSLLPGLPVAFFLAHFLARLARCVTDTGEPVRMFLGGFGQVLLLVLAVLLALLLPWPRLGITPEMDAQGMALRMTMNGLPPSRWLAPWGVLYFSLLNVGTAVVTRSPADPVGDPIPRFFFVPFLLCALLSLGECLRLIGAGAAGRGLGGLLALGAVSFCAVALRRAYERQVLAEVAGRK